MSNVQISTLVTRISTLVTRNQVFGGQIGTPVRVVEIPEPVEAPIFTPPVAPIMPAIPVPEREPVPVRRSSG